MSDFSERIRNLSPQQLAFLSRQLREKGAGCGSGMPRIERQAFGEPLVASFTQSRLWFLQQLDEASPAYNVSSTFLIDPVIQRAELESAYEVLAKRHEILRTIFRAERGVPVPLLLPASIVSIEHIDLTPVSEIDRARHLLEIAEKSVQSPFDLEHGPLWRSVLVHLNNNQQLLLLIMHHIIADGVSLRIFVSELKKILTSALRKESLDLAPLPIQYSDFAAWQRRQVEGNKMDAHLGYWRSQLAGMAETVLPEVSDLPGRHSTGMLITGQCSLTADEVQRLARQQRTTRFVVLLSVFNALIHRYSEENDFGVGTPVSFRARSEVQDLIGCFVNTVVIRARIEPQITFRQLVDQTRETVLDAFHHQELPFDVLVADFARSRRHRSPIFQIMFATLEEEETPTAHAGRAWSDANQSDPVPSPTHAKFDLTLTVLQRGDRLSTVWEYRPAAINDSTVIRLSKEFDALLSAVVAAPDQPIPSSPLTATEAPNAHIETWRLQGEERRENLGSTLHQLVEAQVARTPDAIAVSMGHERLTYAELELRARALAARLWLSPPSEPRVGIFMHRSPSLIVAILAILKAGGAFVPLDPAYPEARLAYIAKDARLSRIVTDRDLAGSASHFCLDGCEIVVPEEDPAQDIAPTLALSSEESIAYVIYTSGSTGTPRGVMIPHQAIVNHMHWMSAAFPLHGDDRVLQRTSISFDPSVWEVFLPLMSGATLVLSLARMADYESLARELQSEKITVVQLVPALFRPLVVSELLRPCVHLRRVFCGGEALEMRLVEMFLKQHCAQLYNLYGPTETTIDSSWWRCSLRSDGAIAPIGEPIHNTQLMVLNDALGPVSSGATGELYIGGVGLARGYAGSPRLTAERFLPCPYSAIPGARMYKTGDRVRVIDNQTLAFLGRVDNQVKFHGYRIEPSEIECALVAHPAVNTALVTTTGATGADAVLVAYFVCEPGARTSADELQGFLRQRLPAYSVPHAFIQLDQFPLLPNGKIDRRQLPGPSGMARYLKDAPCRPRSELEIQLAEIWKEILQIDVVGVRDDFFALGGHSLLATQAISRIRDRFGVALPLVSMFDFPTIEGLAEQINLLLSASPAVVGQGETRQPENAETL
ncbi:MAG TPA: amino acid adenylation domain-containing protein [Candidatus Acidoferrum sp.]|jgi:amino acid adenylation domain-containing protein|nr:amino acid adenylation domain-containing protein [Candidatus Acidoferrum sp.]